MERNWIIANAMPYLIVNSGAGSGKAGRWLERYQSLIEPGWERLTSRSFEEGAALAERAFSQNPDSTCVAVGGDGSLSSVVAGFLRASPPGSARGMVGCLPFGTANDVAKILKLPFKPEEAIRALKTLSPRPLDTVHLELMGQPARSYINIVGFGFDARVTVATTPDLKKRWGHAAYFAAIFKTLREFTPIRLKGRLGDESFDEMAMLAAIANGRYYGGGIPIAPLAEPDDGWLDVILVQEVSKMELVRQLPNLMRGKHLSHPKVIMKRVRSVLAQTDHVEPVSIDGEIEHAREIRCEILPGRVPFGVPAQKAVVQMGASRRAVKDREG
ncbi:MAG: diacylglycerol kinase family lipid kinase [Fimbriimonadia bacterium]|nr:diacylglycerol kinase family lipid kinase [Fimbriimonadia bacterium]